MTTPSETRAGKLLPVMIAEMRNFADVADRCEVTNAPPAIRTWADQLEALAASEPVEALAWIDPAYVPGKPYKATSPVTTYMTRGWLPLYTPPAPEQPGKGERELTQDERAAVEFYTSNPTAAHQDLRRRLAPQPYDPAEGDWYSRIPEESRWTCDIANGGLCQDKDGPWVHRSDVNAALSTPPTAAVSVGRQVERVLNALGLEKTGSRRAAVAAALDPQVKR